MRTRSLGHLADHALLRELKSLAARERVATAELLIYLAEAEERRLHLPAAYPSMHAYCMHELGMSADEALKRIRAARAARRFPALLAAIEDGRLHLSAVVLLAPHLTTESAGDLIAAATRRTKAEVASLLAARCPPQGPPPDPHAPAADEVVPEPPEFLENSKVAGSDGSFHATSPPESGLATPAVGTTAAASPLARLELRVSLDPEAQDLLRLARALLGRVIPTGDASQILKRALIQLVQAEERRVFGRGARTRPRRGATSGRYVPADVRLTVWQRDGGRCSFVSEAGRRCPAHERLEFDHVVPVARGGETIAENLRLRCRAHNQYEAERVFGAGFMAARREQARARRARAKAPASAAPTAAEAVRQKDPQNSQGIQVVPEPPALQARRAEIVPWLRQLGYRMQEAQRGAAMCDEMTDAPLEQRVRAALAGLGRERFLRCTPGASSTG